MPRDLPTPRKRPDLTQWELGRWTLAAEPEFQVDTAISAEVYEGHPRARSSDTRWESEHTVLLSLDPADGDMTAEERDTILAAHEAVAAICARKLGLE